MPKQQQQDIAVGQRWRSRDRRDNGKIVTVEEVDERVNEPGNNGFVRVRSVIRTQMRASTLRTRYEFLSGPRRNDTPAGERPADQAGTRP